MFASQHYCCVLRMLFCVFIYEVAFNNTLVLLIKANAQNSKKLIALFFLYQ
jgi:hypothetical protein